MSGPDPGSATPSATRRIGWGVGDQALSSLTNFAVGITVARTVGPAGFGAFSIGFAAYLTLLGLSRAASSEPLTVRYSGVAAPVWRWGTTRAAGTALVVGAGAGAVMFLTGLMVTGPLREVLVTMGLCLPGLLLQDVWRFAFFAQGKGRAAFANDGIWVLAMAVPVVVIALARPDSVIWPVAAWGGAATIAAAAGCLQARLTPDPGRTREWLREHRDLTGRFMMESASLTGAQQASVFGVGAVAGLAVVGVLRAGQLLLGAVQSVYLAAYLVATPEAVRHLRKRRDLLDPAVKLSVLLAALALLIGGVLLAVPQRVGVSILGTTWVHARAVIVPLSLMTAAAGAHVGASVALRAYAAARHSLRARLVMSVFVVTAEVGGAAVAGAHGAAWGAAAAMWVGTSFWWRQFLVVRSRQRAAVYTA